QSRWPVSADLRSRRGLHHDRPPVWLFLFRAALHSREQVLHQRERLRPQHLDANPLHSDDEFEPLSATVSGSRWWNGRLSTPCTGRGNVGSGMPVPSAVTASAARGRAESAKPGLLHSTVSVHSGASRAGGQSAGLPLLHPAVWVHAGAAE